MCKWNSVNLKIILWATLVGGAISSLVKSGTEANMPPRMAGEISPPAMNIDAWLGFLGINAKWHLNRSQFGIRIDHDLASISDHSLASQSITIWHASDH